MSFLITFLSSSLKDIIEMYLALVYKTANISMMQAYWNIGRLIVEEDQKGEQRAEYGKQIIDG